MQRMMHGLVLDRNAPLYGQAQEILAIGILPAGWLVPALNADPAEAVRACAVWGGVLHEEPARLLLDDPRIVVQPYSILSLIGTGSHRPSEIAARLGKPVSGLARPLAQLCGADDSRRGVTVCRTPPGMP